MLLVSLPVVFDLRVLVNAATLLGSMSPSATAMSSAILVSIPPTPTTTTPVGPLIAGQTLMPKAGPFYELLLVSIPPAITPSELPTTQTIVIIWFTGTTLPNPTIIMNMAVAQLVEQLTKRPALAVSKENIGE